MTTTSTTAIPRDFSLLQRMLHFAVATTMMSIACGPALATLISSAAAATATATSTQTEMRAGQALQENNNNNIAAYEIGFLPTGGKDQQDGAHQHYGYHYDNSNQRDVTADDRGDAATSAGAGASVRRSFTSHSNSHDDGNTGMTAAMPSSASSSSSTAGAASSSASAYNGLTNLSGLRHISNGYGTAVTVQAPHAPHRQIPIYEDQHEDGGASAEYAGENNQHGALLYGSYQSPSLSSLWANYQRKSSAAAAAPSSSPSTYYQQQLQQQQGEWPQQKWQRQQEDPRQYRAQSNDKISDGNFLHHYEHHSGYDELATSGSNEQHQPEFHREQQPWQYFVSADSHGSHGNHGGFTGSSGFHPVSGYSGYGSDVDGSSSSAYDHQQQTTHTDVGDYDGVADDEDPTSNYLSNSHHHSTGAGAEGGGGDGGGGAPQPDVINYIPYPVVKKQHVPVREPVHIPISHAVIVPVSKPVPIHIPVAHQVQVPVEKELRIPVERVVPFPVEKHIPVPVEKRVPYTVVKYVPVKVNRPFPVKVPVFKTILHKVKGGWW